MFTLTRFEEGFFRLLREEEGVGKKRMKQASSFFELEYLFVEAMEDLWFLHKIGQNLKLELGECSGVKGACNQGLRASMGHGRGHMSKREGKIRIVPPQEERKMPTWVPRVGGMAYGSRGSTLSMRRRLGWSFMSFSLERREIDGDEDELKLPWKLCSSLHFLKMN